MNIYLIDNEMIVLKTLQRFLNDLGYDVYTFNSISEFLNDQIHMNGIIIVDLKMPKQDGISMIQQIHCQYPNTDVIVMSSILPFQEAILHGVYSYLQKPIYFDELELILARVAERQNNTKRRFHKHMDEKV